jgi:CRISPR-associated protein Cmr3
LLARLDGEGGVGLSFRSPSDLVEDAAAGTVERLRVGNNATGRVRTDLAGVAEFPTGQGERLDCWLDADQLHRYLDGGAEEVCAELTEERPQPQLVTERRVGLARTPDRTVAPGFLYAAEFWRPAVDGIGFACRVEPGGGPTGLARPVVRLGGEGRHAQVRLHEPDVVSLPLPPGEFEDGRLLLYLATPAIFPDGWRPPVEPRFLVAACVEGPEAVVGFDGSDADGRPTGWALRWAVSAGSVYYLRFPPGEAERFTEHVHGRCLEQATPRLRTAGFGMCLVGRW